MLDIKSKTEYYIRVKQITLTEVTQMTNKQYFSHIPVKAFAFYVKQGPKPTNNVFAVLMNFTVKELYKLAQVKNVKGRSKMNKQTLALTLSNLYTVKELESIKL